MSKSLRTLIILAAIAISLSGWIWGFHHWQVASGAKFSDDEQQLINLQDQLSELTAENQRLAAKIRDLTKNNAGE